MDTIKISVTIPVYNCEKYIKYAIDSIINQTMQDFEIIIIDDGSTDNTISIVESYNDKRIHIYKKNHEGTAAARNYALEKSNGDFIAILDADDMMLSDRLEYQYNYMISNPTVDIITGTMYYIDDFNKNIGGFDDVNRVVTYNDLCNGCCISNPASFIRTSTLKKKPIKYCLDEKYKYAEDYKFWCDALLMGYKIEILSKKVTNYRKHSNQISNKKTNIIVKCAENIKQYIKKNNFNKTNFITFSNSNSNFSFDRVKYEAAEIGLFDNIYCYTEKDFDKHYWNKYKNHFMFKRGYGYMSWKPYFIKKTLEQCNDGDIVVYADTGCMILKENKNELERWMHIAAASDSGILSPCFGPYIEHDWSRGDLYEYINTTYNKNNVDIFDNAIQCGSGVLIFCKKDKSVDFVNQWNDIMSEHFNLCTDEPSTKPNHPNFKENRHDQSAFSMLSKIYGIETIETEHGILDKEHSPIICTRCKDDKYTWKKPISVLYDHQTYDIQKFGGISRMYVELSKETDRNEIVDNFTGNGLATGNYAKISSKFSVLGTQNSYLKEIGNYGKNISSYKENREYTIKLLQEGNFDIFYPTFFDPYFLKYLNGKPFVMSVHDMIPELYPQYFYANDPQIVGKREMVKYASLIEVPTETTKRDLIKILNVEPEKIRVIGRGYNENFGKRIYNSSPVDSPYILYVGQRNLYKRFDLFVKHIANFMNNHPNIKVVCTGNGFNQQEVNIISKYNLQDRFIASMVDDLMLSSLYHYALCFVFSSEYEGFGMPILEAYQCGCITLLNNNECFKEVTQNKAWYFELKDNSSNLSEELEKVYNLTEEDKNNILNIQYQILSNYSWKKSANELTNMFNEVIEANNTSIESNKDTLDLFICTHKDFDVPVKNKCYKIITSQNVEITNTNLDVLYDEDTDISDLEFSYAEGSRIYWLLDNYEFKKYVGLCHYRTFFDFYDNIPNMDEVFKYYDCISLPDYPLGNMNILKQYNIHHYVDDLLTVINIVNNSSFSYKNKIIQTFFDNKLLTRNMFIMRSEDYIECYNFCFSILDEFCKVKGISTMEDIYKLHPNCSKYQSRVLGFLLERLSSAWVLSKFSLDKIKTYNYKFLENSDWTSFNK